MLTSGRRTLSYRKPKFLLFEVVKMKVTDHSKLIKVCDTAQASVAFLARTSLRMNHRCTFILLKTERSIDGILWSTIFSEYFCINHPNHVNYDFSKNRLSFIVYCPQIIFKKKILFFINTNNNIHMIRCICLFIGLNAIFM